MIETLFSVDVFFGLIRLGWPRFLVVRRYAGRRGAALCVLQRNPERLATPAFVLVSAAAGTQMRLPIKMF